MVGGDNLLGDFILITVFIVNCCKEVLVTKLYNLQKSQKYVTMEI